MRVVQLLGTEDALQVGLVFAPRRDVRRVDGDREVAAFQFVREHLVERGLRPRVDFPLPFPGREPVDVVPERLGGRDFDALLEPTVVGEVLQLALRRSVRIAEIDGEVEVDAGVSVSGVVGFVERVVVTSEVHGELGVPALRFDWNLGDTAVVREVVVLNVGIVEAVRDGDAGQLPPPVAHKLAGLRREPLFVGLPESTPRRDVLESEEHVDGELILEDTATEVADELRVVLDTGDDAVDFRADDRPEVELVVLLVRVGEAPCIEAPEADERGEMRPPRRVLG